MKQNDIKDKGNSPYLMLCKLSKTLGYIKTLVVLPDYCD